jgi:4-amino-4-deoxy-L-arabinose transferase-like glycosyltransferase
MLILVVMIARITLTYSVLSATFDEGVHIAAGVQIYEKGRYDIDFEHPPLARLAVGLLPYLDGIRTLLSGNIVEQGRYVLEGSGGYWRTLTLGRLGNLIFVPILLFYVYRWSSELYGRLAGLMAAVLVSASPNILAHAGLASVDFSITATLVPAAYYVWRWLDCPSWKDAFLAGVWGGVALLSKYSAIGFLPAIIVGFLAVWRWRRGEAVWPLLKDRRTFYQTGLYILSLCSVVWLCFQAPSSPTGETVGRLRTVIDRNLSPGSITHGAASMAVQLGERAAPGLVMGLAVVVRHAVWGHEQQFFWGELKEEGGWRLYFPVVLAVKTTLPVLLLLAVAAAVWFVRRDDPTHKHTIYVAVASVALLSVCIASTLNIGVRHILPIYPFLAIFASSLFAAQPWQLRSVRPVMLVSWFLVASHVTASLGAHPDYLPYFNSLARGREHQILGDSNLDWGQDLGRLATYLKENGIGEIHLAYYGSTSPSAVGIEGAHAFGPEDRPRGKIAISVNLLQGLGPEWSRGDYTWLLAHEPYAKIGKAIWLYDIGQDVD